MGLPSNNDYNAMLIVIDQLTKERHYIPCTIDKKDIIAKATTYILLNNIWKLYSLFLSLILDRDF